MKYWVFAGVAALTLAASVQAKKPASSAWAQSEFDTATLNIGRSFAGHDCVKIAASLKAMKLSKDEFETHDEHAGRLSDLGERPLYGTIKVGSKLAFLHTDVLSSGLDLKYDADYKELTVRVSVRNSFVNASEFSWDANRIYDTQRSSHLASNAFGVTARVGNTRSKLCAVAFANKKFNVVNPIQFTATEIPSDVARRLKQGAKVVYIGTVAKPYIGEVSYYLGATLDSPSTYSIQGDAVFISLDELWLVEESTGMPLIKWPGARI